MGVTWSHSRSRALEACPRSVAFALSASKPGLSGSAVDAVTGIAVHAAIDRYITDLQKGAPPNWQDAQKAARDKLEQMWANRATTVQECINGVDVDPSRIDTMRRMLRTHLDRWHSFIWPRFAALKHESHERRYEFPVESARVVVQLDYCAWDTNGNLVIVDWKTGFEPEETASRLQLATYALWAVEQFKIEPSQVIACIAALRTGRVTEYQVTPLDVQDAVERITSDWAVLLDLPANPLEAEARPNFDQCCSCRFLRSCPEGQG